jgi:hypothetical protein
LKLLLFLSKRLSKFFFVFLSFGNKIIEEKEKLDCGQNETERETESNRFKTKMCNFLKKEARKRNSLKTLPYFQGLHEHEIQIQVIY